MARRGTFFWKPSPLRSKLLLAISATLMLLLALLYLPLRDLIYSHFNQIEFTVLNQDSETALRGVERDLSSLRSTAMDYAIWDDTFAFVARPNDDYIQRNFTPPTFENLNIQLIALYDIKGQLRYATRYNQQQRALTSLGPDLAAQLAALLRQPNLEDGGFLLADNEILLISGHAIRPSDGTGPPDGTLIVGQVFDMAALAKLSTTLRLNLQLYSLDASYVPPRVQVAAEQLSGDTPMVVTPLSTASIAAYRLLPDIAGRRRVVLEVSQPRTLSVLGERVERDLIGILIIAALVFGLVMTALLERIVVARTERLSREVNQIRDLRGSAVQVSVNGNDELTQLGMAINQMLHALSKSRAEQETIQQQLLGLNTTLEARVAARTLALEQLNQQLHNELRERAQISDALHTSEALNHSVLNALPAHIAVLDRAGTIIMVNEAWHNSALTSGEPQEQATIGINYLDVYRQLLAHSDDAAEVLAGLEQILAGQSTLFSYEYLCPTSSEQRWYLMYATPLENQQGAVVAHLDITTRKQLEREREALIGQLQVSANIDELTGLANRRAFIAAAGHEWERARRLERPLAALLLDVDTFKLVNDTHGHAAGDTVLQAVAARCRDLIRAIDIVGRYGGEEFVALLPEADSTRAYEVAERLRSGISAEPIDILETKLWVTVSIGVAERTSSDTHLDQLLRRADNALYAAKRAGRNRTIADSSLLQH